MIKASVHKPDGSVLIILGLEGENMARLMSDEPILINAEHIRELLGEAGEGSLRFEIAIMGGADNAALRAKLAPHMGPDTVEHGP